MGKKPTRQSDTKKMSEQITSNEDEAVIPVGKESETVMDFTGMEDKNEDEIVFLGNTSFDMSKRSFSGLKREKPRKSSSTQGAYTTKVKLTSSIKKKPRERKPAVPVPVPSICASLSSLPPSSPSSSETSSTLKRNKKTSLFNTEPPPDEVGIKNYSDCTAIEHFGQLVSTTRYRFDDSIKLNDDEHFCGPKTVCINLCKYLLLCSDLKVEEWQNFYDYYSNLCSKDFVLPKESPSYRFAVWFFKQVGFNQNEEGAWQFSSMEGENSNVNVLNLTNRFAAQCVQRLFQEHGITMAHLLVEVFRYKFQKTKVITTVEDLEPLGPTIVRKAYPEENGKLDELRIKPNHFITLPDYDNVGDQAKVFLSEQTVPEKADDGIIEQAKNIDEINKQIALAENAESYAKHKREAAAILKDDGEKIFNSNLSHAFREVAIDSLNSTFGSGEGKDETLFFVANCMKVFWDKYTTEEEMDNVIKVMKQMKTDFHEKYQDDESETPLEYPGKFKEGLRLMAENGNVDPTRILRLEQWSPLGFYENKILPLCSSTLEYSNEKHSIQKSVGSYTEKEKHSTTSASSTVFGKDTDLDSFEQSVQSTTTQVATFDVRGAKDFAFSNDTMTSDNKDNGANFAKKTTSDFMLNLEITEPVTDSGENEKNLDDGDAETTEKQTESVAPSNCKMKEKVQNSIDTTVSPSKPTKKIWTTAECFLK